jgi:sarcosine oxidase subunit gamma
MVEHDMRKSPLINLSDGFPPGLRELPFHAQINLRGNPEDPNFMEAVTPILGGELPTAANTVFTGKGAKALWLSPDDWLIVAEDSKQHDILWKLEKALNNQHVSVNDLSANRVVLELSGPHVHQVLMKCSEMDFHPRVFAVSDCVQTMIAKSQAIVEQVDTDCFHIYVRCSFSRYVAGWLADAFSEYSP